MPLSKFPQLQEMRDDMDKCSPLYDLYSEQVAFADSNSSMPWADLDINAVQKGVRAAAPLPHVVHFHRVRCVCAH